MRVVGYIRVSTDEQANLGVSLAAQEAKIRAYCGLYDLDLVSIISDAGHSAKTLTRPGLASVLELLESGGAAGLVVAKLDRLTRRVRDLGDLLESHFTRFSLLSVGEQVDTRTAGGRMMLNLLTVVSQWEREVIGERTSTALQHKKTLGQKLGAPALSDEATIERIRSLRSTGQTLADIAARLTAEGCRTVRGGRWYPSTIQKVLRREAV